jgi:drug/metabolite transporter (DMT)-like permease
MSVAVFSIILLAAAFHATWNAIVKGGADTVMTTALVAGSAAFISMAGAPFLPPPSRASWPFLAASTAFQIGYYVLIARTYRIADMSLAYPLMRGTAPLLVAIASVACLGQTLGPIAWIGVVVICGGIVSMVANLRPGQGRGIFPALSNALVIAGYTLIDGNGARRSGAPVAYAFWLFLFSGAPFFAWVFWVRRTVFRTFVADHWRVGLAGGFGTVASYGLALWAMTRAPIAVVAALRETSILFGTAISAFVLKERVTRARIVGACIIAAGAVVLRLA